MIIGALLQATSYYKSQLIVARIVSGFGMGFINSTVPVLMAEFAPKATRGIFVCAQLVSTTLAIEQCRRCPLSLRLDEHLR